MRRWMRYQKTLSKKRWFEQDRERNGPITLFDFSTLDDAVDAALVDESSKKGGWRISDDSVIGGYSKGAMHLIPTSGTYKQYLRGDTSYLDPILLNDDVSILEKLGTEEEIKDDNGEEVATNFVPFARWKGNIDTRVNEKSDVQRSGFCAIRSPEFPFGGVDLEGRYNGLELKCRSDGRQYSIMLKLESLIPDDMYQCFITIPPTIPSETEICPDTGGRFDNVVVLFEHFIVTSSGRMKAQQRDLDNSVRIRNVGVSLMDGLDGPFQFDLARVRAVNYDERGVIGEAD
jgi:hypothetical protein